MTKSLTEFKAVYCSGIFIPESATVSALSLLFEKVYLPNNIEIVREFSKKYRIISDQLNQELDGISIDAVGHENDPFEGLTEKQRETALNYLRWGRKFVLNHTQLFSEVFETEMFDEGEPLQVELVQQGAPGELNRYRVSHKPMILTSEDEDTFPRLINEGYIPVVSNSHSANSVVPNMDAFSAKQLAALLAMKSVEMLIPRTKGTHPEIILEARSRLSDQLPPFWSSMLKLSVELKQRIEECKTVDEVLHESQELVDTTVRPSLIDLQDKMSKERKDWFYKILSPVQKGLLLMIGNPPLTQQQLMTNALVLSADVAMTTAENMRTINNLKNEAGLTFLLEASKLLEK